MCTRFNYLVGRGRRAVAFHETAAFLRRGFVRGRRSGGDAHGVAAITRQPRGPARCALVAGFDALPGPGASDDQGSGARRPGDRHGRASHRGAFSGHCVPCAQSASVMPLKLGWTVPEQADLVIIRCALRRLLLGGIAAHHLGDGAFSLKAAQGFAHARQPVGPA